MLINLIKFLTYNMGGQNAGCFVYVKMGINLDIEGEVLILRKK
jgi:hypothetical protein